VVEAQEAGGVKLQRRAGTLLLWLSGALLLVLFVVMAIHAAPLSPGIPALQLTFDEAAFKAILTQWGPAGIERFRTHFFIDFPMLTSYGVFGYLLVRHSRIFERLGTAARGLVSWILPAAAVLDAGENLLHIHLITKPATHTSVLYLIAGLVATGKWLLIVAFAVGALSLLVTRGRR
jgi:hypothetical protein